MIGARRASAALAWIGAVLVLAGGLLTYTGGVLADSGQFAHRATSVLKDPSVRALIGASATTQLVRAAPDLVSVQPLLAKAVVSVVASSAFQSIVQGALFDVHRTVFVT